MFYFFGTSFFSIGKLLEHQTNITIKAYKFIFFLAKIKLYLGTGNYPINKLFNGRNKPIRIKWIHTKPPSIMSCEH